MPTGAWPPLAVRFWGPFACFTRPEMKVERVSYPVMTPSAARGALEAIFWKPEVRWAVREIRVLRPIRYLPILRNEVTARASEHVAAQWARAGGGYDASAPEERAQRHSLVLRDVAYLVIADLQLQPSATDDIAKYRDQFQRRVVSGRCFSVPYLGCREFSASFGPPDPGERPIDVTDDLGRMLLEIDYAPGRSGRGSPRFFEAHLDAGVMRVPQGGWAEP